MSICTRFAPSPTGYLHIGSARTALYSWLYAKKMGGEFILRIEDTDRARSTKEAIDVILEGMKWLELDWTMGPFYQTDNYERYYEVANQLLENGKAYRCDCSKERLEALREKQIENKQKPKYDGHCRDKNLSEDTPSFVVRLKTPLSGSVEVNDVVHGTVIVENSELDDLILLRSDKHPTYHFSVVIDDMDLNVTHVIRGDDHLNNTPRQINLINALGAKAPIYAHIPMILGDDGKKMSKRHGAASVLQYKEDGILPHALLNYLVRLGWSHKDKEIFSIQEMIELFDLKDINKSGSAVNHDKLIWLNQHYIKTLSIEELLPHVTFHFEKHNIDFKNGPKLDLVIDAQRERVKTLEELALKSEYFYNDNIVYDEKAWDKNMGSNLKEPLTYVKEFIKKMDNFDIEPLHNIVKEAAEKFDIKLGKIAQPIRIAMTGNTISPSIDITLFLIGKDRVINRLEKVISKL